MIEQGLVPGTSRNWEDRKARSHDFGRMIKRMPEAVATPKSAGEVSSIVRRAAKDQIQIAIRGRGHSQGGQSLTDHGLVLDTTCLNRVKPLGPELVRAQGGTQWGKVVDALHGTRRLPRVLVDIAEATVGGTLSAGGLGTTSHRYGVQVGLVEQLEVVTGTGERVLCSSTQDEDLFAAVRGGQGQFGVITEAWIRLRAAGEWIRQYDLRYCDFDRFASDFEQIVDGDRFDHLRAEVRSHDHEIILNAGIEYDEDLEDEKALEGLGHDKILNTRDTTKVGRAVMFPSWGFSRRNYHPWRDWFMPWQTLRTLLAQSWLDPQWMPRAPLSWTGIYPIRAEAIDAPFFMHPKGERMISYSILAVLGKYEKANELARRLKEIDRTLVKLGGKSYLSGSVGYGHKEWKEHYGEMLTMGIRLKSEFDPKQVFRGEGMPFEETPTASGQ